MTWVLHSPVELCSVLLGAAVPRRCIFVQIQSCMSMSLHQRVWLHVQVVGSGRSVACRCRVQASKGTRGDGGRSFRPKRSKFVDQFRLCFAIGRCLLRGRVDHLGHPPVYEAFKQGCVGRRKRSWLAPFEGARIRHSCMHACVHSRPRARTRPFTGSLPIGYDAAAVAPVVYPALKANGV